MIEELIASYQNYSSIRDPRLFSEFLVRGYRMTTLDGAYAEEAVMAKLHLGMLITFYDDLADNPAHFNPELLQRLYSFDPEHELAARLMKGIFRESLPGYATFKELLMFDLQQFFHANRYSELMTIYPGILNLAESRLYGPFNMGMVAAGTIDLMACPDFDPAELGAAREIFILGQRLGRIGNLISTFERELAEGDTTNEILVSGVEPERYKFQLRSEIGVLGESLCDRIRRVRSVDFTGYVKGLTTLFDLHLEMKGII